jgi:ribosome maturation factor RimP
VEDVIPGGRYDLEVSSPGLDRKLTQPWHFEGAVGKRVRLQFRDEQGQIKPYEGKLIGIEDNGSRLSFENAKGPFAVEFANVQKARVLLEDPLPKKPAPGKKR